MATFDPLAAGAKPADAPFDPVTSGAVAVDDPAPVQAPRQPLDPLKLFGGVENFDKVLDPQSLSDLNNAVAGQPDQVLAKKRAANLAFLSLKTGHTMDEIAPVADQHRDQYAREVLKAPAPLDDSGFYSAVGTQLQKQADENGMIAGMMRPLFDAQRKGQSFNDAYASQFQAIKDSPGYDPTRQDLYRQTARANWDQFDRDSHILAAPIASVSAYFNFLRSSENHGQQGIGAIAERSTINALSPIAGAVNALRGTTSDADAEQAEQLRKQAIDTLSQLSDDQAQMVMDYAAGGADQKQGQSDSFGKKLELRVGRGVQNLVGGALDAGGNLISRVLDDPAMQETRNQSAKLGRQLDQRITGEVDPLKGQGWIAKQALNVAEVAPRLLSIMSGPGIVVNYAATKEEIRGNLEDRGLTPNQADVLSGIAAVPETALNFVSANMVVGLAPGGSALIKSTSGGIVGRLAKTAGVETAGLLGQAYAQQITTPLIQKIASVIDPSVPGLSLVDEAKNIIKSTPETLSNLVPFILIGTGSAHFRDRANGLAKIQNRDGLQAVGLPEDTIRKVMAAGVPEDAEAIIQNDWDKRSPGPVQQEALDRLNLNSIEQRESLGRVYSEADKALFNKYPETFNSIPMDAVPAEVEHPDGKLEPVSVAGWTEKPDPSDPAKIIEVPLIGRLGEFGWTHTPLPDSMELKTDIPDAEQWREGQRSVPRFKTTAAGVRDRNVSNGSGTATSFEEDMMAKWKREWSAAKTADGQYTITGPEGPIGEAATPEGAAGVVMDHQSAMDQKAADSPQIRKEDHIAAQKDDRPVMEKIKEIVNKKEFDHYGLRVIPDDLPSPTVGETLDPSYRWEDGKRTDDLLSGSSGADASDPEKAARDLGIGGKGPNGFYYGSKVALIGSNDATFGEDIGEKIFSNAQVLGVWDKTDKSAGGFLENNQVARTPLIPEIPKALLDIEKRVDARLDQIRAEGRSFSLGLDPEQTGLLIVKSALKIARGARDLAAFTEGMIADFGESIRPHLQDLFKQGQDYLEHHLTQAQAAGAQAGERTAGRMAMASEGIAEKGGELRERTVTRRMAAGEGIAKEWEPEAKEVLKNILYPVEKMESSRAGADRELEAGTAAALARFRDPTAEMTYAERTSLGIKLAARFKAEGENAAWHQTLMELAQLGTSEGQGINMFKDLGANYTTPEAAQIMAIQEGEKAKRQIRKATKSDKVAEEITKAVKEDRARKDVLTKLKERMEELTRLTNEGTTTEISDAIGPKTIKQVSAQVKELQDMIAGAKKGLEGELKTTLDAHEVKLRDLRAKIEENTRLLNEGTTEEIKAKLGDEPKILAPADIAELKKALKDSQKALQNAVEEPTDFEAKIKARLEARNIKTPKNVMDLYKAAVDLFNQGKLSAKGVEDVLLKKHGLPDFGEHAAALADFANKIASTPENSVARRDATIDLFDYVRRQIEPMGAIDKGFALFYAGIISGYPTVVRIAASNLFSIAEQGAHLLMTSPARWAQNWDAALNGARSGAAAGMAEALNVLRTGKNSVMRQDVANVAPTSALEANNFQGVFRPYNLSKYVSRLHNAIATFTATTAYEMKSRQVAWELAKQMGESDPIKVAEAVDKFLNQTPQQISDHAAQAAEEFKMLHPDLQSKTWIDDRTRELTLMNRREELVVRASDLAARSTFSQKPEGLVGFFANKLVDGFTELRKMGDASNNTFLKLLSVAPRVEIPFIRLPANLFAVAWEYGSGLSIAKALYGKELDLKARAFVDMSSDQQQMMLRRGITGMATLATLAVSGWPTKDGKDDDRFWRIHGKGTGDPDRDRALYGPKFKPYSIQIGTGKNSYFLEYKFLPVGPALAMVGAVHDGERYGTFNAKDGTYRLASAMRAIPSAMFSQTFFKQLEDTAEALVGDGHKSEEALRMSLARATAGTAAAVAIPFANFWRTIDRDFDPNVRDIDTVKAAMMAQVPLAERLLNPKLDALGEDMSNRPADWLYTKQSQGSPEAAIYKLFAKHNIDPGDGSSYKLELGDKYYEFFKARNQYIKSQLMDPDLRANIDAQPDYVGQAIVHGLGRVGTQLALQQVGYTRKPKHGE